MTAQCMRCFVASFMLFLLVTQVHAAVAPQSPVSASTTSVPADGVTSATVTVTLIDLNGAPVQGDSISVTQGSGASSITYVAQTSDAAGHASFTVKSILANVVTYTVTESAGGTTLKNTATVTFTAIPPPAITGVLTANGTVGMPLSYSITASGYGTLNYSTSSLPPGLVLTGSTISGTPTDFGIYTVTVTVSDNFGNSAGQVLAIAIAPPPAAITSPLTATAKIGTAFSYSISATGTEPFSFDAEGLPDGVIIVDNIISGIPVKPGSYPIVLLLTDSASQSDTQTLVLTVLDKKGALPPVITSITADTPNATGTPVTFTVNVATDTNQNTSEHWDFGDGSTGDGDFVTHPYASAGTYAATVTVSDGTNSTTSNVQVQIVAIDPNAPVISGIAVSANPANVNDLLTFTAEATDPNGAAITYTWNFGDGSPMVSGASVTHAYTASGDYTVVLSATNTSNLAALPFSNQVFVMNGPGEQNIETGKEPDASLNGITVGLDSSNNGVIQLDVNLNTLNRAAFEVTTDFGLSGLSAVRGTAPVAKFSQPGLYVATSTAQDIVTKKFKGKARKTIPISRREVGLPPLITGEPSDHTIHVQLMKGEFNFGPSAVAPGAATTRVNSPLDSLSASMNLELPTGFVTTKPQQIQIAMGNVTDTITIDTKGRGKGKITGFQLRPKGKHAQIAFKITAAGMVQHGFDTEGVLPTNTAHQCHVQCAFLIAGVAYTWDLPMALTVAKDGMSAKIAGKGN